MAFDAFISYSHLDKTTADATTAILEAAGVRCWIAPRDIEPGKEWGGAIVDAIDACRVLVVIFSSNANQSRQVVREIERAISNGTPVIPIRIEDIAPTSSMAYFMNSIHWLDALSPPLEEHLVRLANSIKALLSANSQDKDAVEAILRSIGKAPSRTAAYRVAYWFVTLLAGGSCAVLAGFWLYHLGDVPIKVISATYGGNCDVPSGNATDALAKACNAKTSCDYTIDYKILGDPKYLCAKDFYVEWQCGESSRNTRVGKEAGYESVVHLDCE